MRARRASNRGTGCMMSMENIFSIWYLVSTRQGNEQLAQTEECGFYIRFIASETIQEALKRAARELGIVQEQAWLKAEGDRTQDIECLMEDSYWNE